MSEPTLTRAVSLVNGLTLNFYDRTNRYFGDFHRVLVVVEGSFDVQASDLSDEIKVASNSLTDPILYRRELERMGVTSERLEETVCELVESFLVTAKAYLERPSVPGQLIIKRLADKGKRRPSPLRGRL